MLFEEEKKSKLTSYHWRLAINSALSRLPGGQLARVKFPPQVLQVPANAEHGALNGGRWLSDVAHVEPGGTHL